MIYQYDQALQLPTVDLYDTLLMAMALNAAKDMYEKGEQLIKDFLKAYGDFLTPITADQDWWNQNVTGKVRDAINQMYARGGDPLRNALDRALISMLINNIPYGEIAKMKSSAENAKDYLKNRAELQAKGLWNPDMEAYVMGGRSLEDWDTSKDGTWTRTSPSEYKDLNKFTTHIFDALDDSYIETKDHYDWYGVTPEAMMNSLTSDTIGGLIDSDLGRFHLNNAKNDLIAQGNLNPTDSEILNLFKNNIVAANAEKTHRNRKLNEMWKMLLENYARRASGGGGSRNTKQSIAYDSAEGLFYRGLIKSGGTSHYSDIEKAVEDGRDNIVLRLISLMKLTQSKRMNTSLAEQYILDNLSIEEAPGNFSRYAQIPLTNGVMPIDKHWSQRFFSDESVVSHMYGITYGTHEGGTGKRKSLSKRYTDRTGLIGKAAIPTTKVRTTFTQRANGEYAIRLFWLMEIGDFDKDTGDFRGSGTYKEFELPTSRKATNNMPDYNTWKNMNAEDKDVIIRPSLSEDPNTLGWKNTGSMQVNMYEHVPVNLGFPGTSNNEAYETP